MPRKGTKLSPEAAEKQAAAIDAWHRENTEIIKFSVRLPKGRGSAYRELAAATGRSLTSIVKECLDEACRKAGIEI